MSRDLYCPRSPGRRDTQPAPDRHLNLGDTQTNAVRPGPDCQSSSYRYVNERAYHSPYSGWFAKNFHIRWSAEMANVVFPTTDAIATIASLPAHTWPSPLSR
jgi:hypothetical protein